MGEEKFYPLRLQVYPATATLRVARGDDITRLEASTDLAEGAPAPRSLPIPKADLVRALTDELAQVSEDVAFIGALNQGLALHGSPAGAA